MTVAYGKLYMKDASGNIVQIVPDSVANSLVDSTNVTHGSKTVSTALQDLDSSIQDLGSSIQNLETAISSVEENGVKSVFAEIEGKSQSESETVHMLLDGWIGSSISTEPFKITVSFGYMSGGSGGSFNFITKNATAFTNTGGPECEPIDGHRMLKSNVRHTCTFTFDDNYSFSALSIMTTPSTVTTLDNGRIVSGRYGVVGKGIIPSSEYNSWTFDSNFIELSFPSIGNSVELKINAIQSNGTWNAIPEPTMFVELKCTANKTYALDFWWEYEEDRVVESSLRWKELKTTTVLPDDTQKTVSKPIAGLLQDVKGSSEDAFSYDYVSGNSGAVSSVSQVKSINLAKEDANGAIVTEKIELKPSTVVSYSASQANVGDVVGGFVCGIDSSSLAPGGIYLEVESMFETQN